MNSRALDGRFWCICPSISTSARQGFHVDLDASASQVMDELHERGPDQVLRLDLLKGERLA